MAEYKTTIVKTDTGTRITSGNMTDEEAARLAAERKRTEGMNVHDKAAAAQDSLDQEIAAKNRFIEIRNMIAAGEHKDMTFEEKKALVEEYKKLKADYSFSTGGPVDIGKNLTTAEKMVRDATSVFRQYMEIPFIPEEEEFLFKAFGGKPGQGRVKTPKKLTPEQAMAFLDYSGFPLADENAKFSIASSIKLGAPELFDDASFKAYENKFGKVMEMQEKGASASKKITTAKTPEAANKPVADVDYNAKIRDGNITVREAFEAVLNKKLKEDNKRNIEALFKRLPDEGIDLDANYFDVYDSKEFYEAFDYTTNKTGVHRYKEFGAFETQFEGLIRTSKRNEPYARLTDSGGKPGIATDNGLTGKQLRAADPMRATVSSEALDKIYHDALIAPGVTETDTKRGIDKTVIIDPEARDYLLYEKYTGQRVESNIGPDGLKISDFNFFTDENGQTVVEVASKKVGTKTRPEATYTGEFAEFLRNKVERAKATLPPDADLTKVNLFQTNSTAVTKLWNDRIRPELEKNHRQALPAQKGGSHSSLRKILARQLQVEFKFPRDAVKAWMGHAGAGVDAAGDILSESYVGTAPDERIGEMTNTLIRNDARNSGANNVNTMFVNRGAGFSQEIIFETPSNKVMGTVDLLQSNVASRPPTAGELEELSAAASSRAVETEIVTEGRRKYLSRIQSERATAKTVPTDAPLEPGEGLSSSLDEALRSVGFDNPSQTIDDLFESIKSGVDKTLKVGGTALIGAGLYEAVRDPTGAGAAMARDLAIEGVGLAAKIGTAPAAALPMVLEASPAGEGSTREEFDYQDYQSVEETDEDRMARIATEDAGFIPEASRVPEAAPATDQGFLSR